MEVDLIRGDLIEKFDAFVNFCNKEGLTEHHLKILDIAIKDDIFLQLEEMKDYVEKLHLEINELRIDLKKNESNR